MMIGAGGVPPAPYIVSATTMVQAQGLALPANQLVQSVVGRWESHRIASHPSIHPVLDSFIIRINQQLNCALKIVITK